MAVITLGSAREFDFIRYYNESRADLVSHSAKSAVVKMGAYTMKLTGSKFTFDGEEMTGGNITGISFVKGGVNVFTATGISVSAYNLAYYIFKNADIEKFLFSSNDIFRGTDGSDRIFAYAGHDTISGNNGHDVIDGGVGNDRILAGAGNDTVSGDAGNDQLYGGDGNDLLRGDNPTLSPYGTFTKDVHDTLVGGAGHDTLIGGHGNDVLYGDDGNDKITGGFGNDLIYGGAGNDTIYGGYGQDTIDGGDGDDFISLGFYNWDTPAITVHGGAGNDTILGEVNERSYGDAGNDSIYATYGWGGDGNDTLTGGTLYGESGDDSISGTVVYGGDGNDTIVVSGWGSGDGGSGDDRLTTRAGSDYQDLNGGDGNDTLITTSYSSDLTGGAGDDLIIFSGHENRATGGDGADKYQFIQPSNVPTLTATITDFESGIDLIDLSTFDANPNLAGHQSFTIGAGSAFSKQAGELLVSDHSIRGDLDGDGYAEFQITFTGTTVSTSDIKL